ncbi:non-ribosomal peptide synthetase [Kitasatospora sp. NPDC050543]|uniref:non-ribosomal peptide synthetase n=1 Tax=Kitasatospora sp. NPDC050543 TaxID=3364054 RepID=UPI00378D1F59
MTPHDRTPAAESAAEVASDITTGSTIGSTAGSTAARISASPASGAPFRRPVSATEWLYLGAHRLGRAMVLQLVVEGEGELDPAGLQAAVTAAAQACPGSRLVRRGRTWLDSGRPPQVRVAGDGSGPDAELRDGTAPLETPLDLAHGPGCEVLLIPGTPSRPTTVVFRAFHGVMDGHGAQLWLAEVFRALRGDPPRPARSALTDAELLAAVGATGRRPALLLDQPSPLAAAPGTRAADAAGAQALWRRRTLPGRYPSLTARLASAVAGATGAPRARVMVPVDVRRHHDGPPATGNLTLPVFLDLAAGESWQAAHSRLLRALTQRGELAAGFESTLARLPLAATAALLRAGQAVAARRDRHMASAVVSHLGRINPAECSGGGFTARSVYALPVHAPLVPVSCVAVELPDRTELTVGFQGGPGLAARADELMDRLVAAVAAPGAARPGRAGPAPAGATAPTGAEADGTTVVRLLRQQARRTPDATALDGPAGPVSYAELDRRSDAVATELLRRGVHREDVVGLLVERSPSGVAGLWGVLKAGAAYLPMDPHQPDTRIAQILRESGSVLCVTERHLLDRTAAIGPCPALAVEDVQDAEPDTGPDTGRGTLPRVLAEAEPTPEQLAYVIYTSGSTGRPKGVQIEHRGLLAFARWAAGLCRVDERTRFAFLSSFAFDISCFPLFLPLLHGGTTVLVPGGPTRPALRELLERHRADTLAVTPTHLNLIETYDLDLSGVRTLLAGGEQLTRAAAGRARRRLGPDGRIVNGYGPTEATVGCLAHVLDGTEDGPVVPIGQPAPSVRVELVAGGGEPIPPEQVGAVGEILLSGLQLARGYLGRPDLDAASFPVGADGVRRYRTGDLGRRLPGGAVEFVGRTDDQLKIAGHRIEPAEVQAALESHPAVTAAAVTVRTRPGGGPALCAYVLTAEGAAGPDAAPGLGAALREQLAELLPAHLVPAVVLPITELPRTVTGKTDTAALPDPFAPHPAPSGAGAAADADDAGRGERGNGEGGNGVVFEEVAALWCRALGVDRRLIDADSDFQQLGGDSLALLEMLSAVADELLDPPQADAFTAELSGTLAELTPSQVVAAVRRVRRETEEQQAGPGRPVQNTEATA